MAANCYYSNQTLKAKRITSSANKLIPLATAIGTHHASASLPTCMQWNWWWANCVQTCENWNWKIPFCTIHCHQNRALNSEDLFKCILITCEEVFCLIGLHWCNKSISFVLILICYLEIPFKLLCFFHLIMNPPSCINPQNLHGHYF